MKNPTSVVEKIKPWRKEFSNLQEPEGSICTLTSSHWKTPLTPTQFPESHQPQTFPIGSLKVQFSHRNMCQYWRNIIWCSVHIHLHSHHRSPKQIISQSFIGVLAKIPSRIRSFQLKNKTQKTKQIYINHSDLTERTGHWIENQCLKYFKKRSFVFKQSETDKEKVYTLVCVVHKISNSVHY